METDSGHTPHPRCAGTGYNQRTRSGIWDRAADDDAHPCAVRAFIISSCALIQLTTLCLLTLSGSLPATHAYLMATPPGAAAAASLLALLTAHKTRSPQTPQRLPRS
ncbi:hypothetical protein [Streptomyces sp. NBC_01614]|uniref:hypothetical protein n=1 Tax=Streptomyces sp. NBC_01614 TaxID=2975897 RepID=UPI00386BC90A